MKKKEPTLKAQLSDVRARLVALESAASTYYLDMDRHIRAMKDLSAHLHSLEKQVDYARLEAARTMKDLTARVSAYEEVFGPVWKTASGFKVVPSMMSDNHIENVLQMPNIGMSMRGALVNELERRAFDVSWHQKAGKVAPPVVIAKLSRWLRWIL